MCWAKRNLYFLISCVLAVGFLGAGGWFCYSELQRNGQSWEDLKKAYDELQQISDKQPNAGDGKVDNIKTAREQAKEAQERSKTMRKFFIALPSIPNTNRIDDRALAFAVRDTIRQMRIAASYRNV